MFQLKKKYKIKNKKTKKLNTDIFVVIVDIGSCAGLKEFPNFVTRAGSISRLGLSRSFIGTAEFLQKLRLHCSRIFKGINLQSF